VYSPYRHGRPEIPPAGILHATKEQQMESRIYTVPGMHCGHCQAAVTEELQGVPGVQSVDVDLDSKLVTVSGEDLDDTALRSAIAEAGYEVAA
jgi:copper chaperone